MQITLVFHSGLNKLLIRNREIDLKIESHCQKFYETVKSEQTVTSEIRQKMFTKKVNQRMTTF